MILGTVVDRSSSCMIWELAVTRLLSYDASIFFSDIIFLFMPLRDIPHKPVDTKWWQPPSMNKPNNSAFLLAEDNIMSRSEELSRYLWQSRSRPCSLQHVSSLRRLCRTLIWATERNFSYLSYREVKLNAARYEVCFKAEKGFHH